MVLGSLLIAAWGILLGRGLHEDSSRLVGSVPTLAAWIAVVILLNLLPVLTRKSPPLIADQPFLVAAAMVLTPLESGLVVFLGAMDAREWRGQISFGKALFNRSQTALATYSASVVAHALSITWSQPVLILLLAFLVLLVELAINYLVVSIALVIQQRVKFFQAIGTMRVGTNADFMVTMATWGFLGFILAFVYNEWHSWALLIALGPAVLCRQALLRSQMFLESRRAQRSTEEALSRISDEIYKERHDERRLIAADLHDEVLQPLFKVSLMAHVLKADLATGRLLELDKDLPDLLSAAELASNTLRDLISDLRKSTLGRGGLCPALSNLLKALQSSSGITAHAELKPVDIDSKTQLHVYQIAREALTNAVSHSRARDLWVTLEHWGDVLQLEVADNGVGFDANSQFEGHYGLLIMRERASSVGGSLFIDSEPGKGTKVTLVVDAKPNEKTQP